MSDKRFIKYQHLERLGSVEVEGILDGTCYVFPKIDGTNASVWFENGQLMAGSRKRVLSRDADNHGFYDYVMKFSNFTTFHDIFNEYPDLVIYGEFLVPHTLKTYRPDAWRKFYAFDVYHKELERYLTYEEYSPILELFGIEFIRPLKIIKNPTIEDVLSAQKANTYLIGDGLGVGEGVVIKNYSFVNKFGRVTWAKVVANEFKEKPIKAIGPNEAERDVIEQRIVDKYVTEHMVNKEYAKLAAEDGWSSKLIPRLLSTVYYTLITEEAWSFIKEFKNPTIDFKKLQNLTVQKTKEFLPNLFRYGFRIYYKYT